eukprot:scaffold2316_cov135-Skeletonema_menzelii.AAC.8
MMRVLLLTLVSLISATTCNASVSVHASSLHQSLVAPIAIGIKRATRLERNNASAASNDFAVRRQRVRGGSAAVSDKKPPPIKLLRWAYTAAGVATTSAWGTMVYTAIRDNQPPGAMMPSWQHPVFARIGVMSAAALIVGSFASLATTCSEPNDVQSWEELGDTSPSFRRQNLALATTGVASSLWVRFAEQVTKIPGTSPVAHHISYNNVMQARLIGAYGTAGILSALVWARTLPEEHRNPLTWPKRIGDGVSKALVSLAPDSVDDPVQVKYSLITASMLIFTGMQTVCNMPYSVISSWTSRRLSRAFPIYTFLGAVTAFDLKEATENGRLLIDKNYRCLSNGMKGFGSLYLGARAGAIFFDPSFPEHFGMVTQVPGLAVAAMMMVGLTLRSDEK